jgi:SpoVK/Ycf46/Vps4 family AAA+-type ATPase
MEVDEVKEITMAEFFDMCEKEEGEFEIDTPDGWKAINFLVKKQNRRCFKLVAEEGYSLCCSSSHRVMTVDGWKKAKDVVPQVDIIVTKDGEKRITEKQDYGLKDTFDLQVDSRESRYYSDGIVSHNCGKSYCCKAISGNWEMPLLRLDFGKLFQSYVGDSERNARAAIKLAEAIAPTILWIDEIEKGISGNSGGRLDSGVTSRVLSTFLTWMQEKESPVFVVATANDHESIPPEFLRAGRFDEIFFVDLPNKQEREEIFQVLLGKRKLGLGNFDLHRLSTVSDGYSGAEIEKAIDEAMLAGFEDGKRSVDTEDVVLALNSFVPLSVMREADFSDLREWADGRCRKANAAFVEAPESDFTLKRDLEIE